MQTLQNAEKNVKCGDFLSDARGNAGLRYCASFHQANYSIPTLCAVLFLTRSKPKSLMSRE